MKTGAIRMFSAQYGITTTPRDASGFGNRLPTTSFATGSVPVSGMTCSVLQVGIGSCALAMPPNCNSVAMENAATV